MKTIVEGLDQGGKLYVASVSPQTRASIAATFRCTEREAGYMIQQLLSGPQGIKNKGVYRNKFEWVVDTNVAREACLVLGADEVVASMGVGGREGPSKPILTSSCPGWICYAEKTHPHVLPHLSRLKSPQALMGTLLKTMLSKKLDISPERIWHVAIMPCFDKKLEASREELSDAVWNGTGGGRTRDVDCVITSKELLMLAESRRVDFAKLPRSPLPSSSQVPFPDPRIYSFLFPPARRKNSEPVGGTSGGYLYHILQHIASQHEGSSIQTSRGRNADVLEYTIASAGGEPLFKAARYYGFRNIQNLVRRLKPANASRMPGGKPLGGARRVASKASGPEHAYVEVMACPGGCTNGGGQIKVDDPVISGRDLGEYKPGPQEQKDWLAQVDEAYFSADDSEDISQGRTNEANEINPSLVKDILAHWSSTTNIDIDKLVYTSYRAVISDVGKQVSDTQRAVEIAGKIGGGW